MYQKAYLYQPVEPVIAHQRHPIVDLILGPDLEMHFVLRQWSNGHIFQAP